MYCTCAGVSLTLSSQRKPAKQVANATATEDGSLVESFRLLLPKSFKAPLCDTVASIGIRHLSRVWLRRADKQQETGLIIQQTAEAAACKFTVSEPLSRHSSFQPFLFHSALITTRLTPPPPPPLPCILRHLSFQ